MKKVYIILPVFVSYIIISSTALIFPGNGTDGYTIQYGYPLPFLYVDKEISLAVKDTIVNYIATNLIYFLINIILLTIVINIFIWIYKKIRARIKKPDSTKI